MVIVINHLTRMKAGFICAAGVDVASGRHIRPAGRLTTRLLARERGPLALGAIVDLGDTRHVGTRPEVEDHYFEPRRVTRVGAYEPAEFWSLLTQLARARLRALFGKALRPGGQRGCGVDVGTGMASLGCLVPACRPVLLLQKRPGRPDRIRLHVSDPEFDLDLSVTDIRLFAGDQFTPDAKRLAWMEERLQTTRTAILGVGLTRPFSGSRDQPPLHWLQVNNIHLADEPLWN